MPSFDVTDDVLRFALMEKKGNGQTYKQQAAEIDRIRKRPDDPYAQKVFADLLKQAIAEAEAMFDHPLKQYALFKDFEQRVEGRQTPGVPHALDDNLHAKAYFGAIRLALGEPHFASAAKELIDTYTAEARVIYDAVRLAVAENSLNLQNVEAAIRNALLPRLFALMGLDAAKAVIDQVVHITRVGLGREA